MLCLQRQIPVSTTKPAGRGETLRDPQDPAVAWRADRCPGLDQCLLLATRLACATGATPAINVEMAVAVCWQQDNPEGIT